MLLVRVQRGEEMSFIFFVWILHPATVFELFVMSLEGVFYVFSPAGEVPAD